MYSHDLERCLVGDGGIGVGHVGIEDGIYLGVAMPAGYALKPYHVAVVVEHHVEVSR